MNLDIMKIYEYNNELNKKENEIKCEKELRSLLGDIVTGNNTFTTYDEMLINKLKQYNIKYKSTNRTIHYINCFDECVKKACVVELNKTNISKIQKMLNDLNK